MVFIFCCFARDTACVVVISCSCDRDENAGVVVVARAVVDICAVRDMDPPEPLNMRFCDAFELTQAAPLSSCVNIAALMNMRSMLFTLETSH